MRCKCGNCCVELLISVVIAAIIGVLFALGVLPQIFEAVTPAFFLALFAIFVLSIGLFIVSCKMCLPLKKCLCCYAPCILAGIIGTIIFSLVVLSISFVVTTPVIIVISLWALFVTLLVVSLLSFLVCIICNLCCCRPCK